MNGYVEDHRRFNHDTEYYKVRHEELVKSYPDQWVAIFDQRVVGTGLDGDKLIYDI